MGSRPMLAIINECIYFAWGARLVEQVTVNDKVVGSIPIPSASQRSVMVYFSPVVRKIRVQFPALANVVLCNVQFAGVI